MGKADSNEHRRGPQVSRLVPNRHRVAKLIRDARVRAGLTQAELAEKIGWKPAVIGNYETATPPGFRGYERIRAVLTDLPPASEAFGQPSPPTNGTLRPPDHEPRPFDQGAGKTDPELVAINALLAMPTDRRRAVIQYVLSRTTDTEPKGEGS